MVSLSFHHHFAIWLINYNFSIGEFGGLVFVCVDPLDRILVSDTDNNRIQIFSSDGRWIHTYQVDVPVGITVDKENGDIYVVCFLKNRVLVF